MACFFYFEMILLCLNFFHIFLLLFHQFNTSVYEICKFSTFQ